MPEERSRTRDRAASMLSKMHSYTTQFADEHSGKNRGLAAAATAAILGMGIDKTNGEHDLQYTEEELEALKNMASPEEDRKSDKSHHFVDMFLERMIRVSLPMDEPELAAIEAKLRDPDRAAQPRLSIKILALNFKTLSSKMSLFFAAQYAIVHIITWRNPYKTLSFLVLYTSVCLWPHLVLAYPLVFVLFGIIVPGYIHRHPMGTPELIKVKKRGQSLWDFFHESEDQSIVDDILSEDSNLEVAPVSSQLLAGLAAYVLPDDASEVGDENEKVQKKAKTRYVKSQVTLLMNMRDLQNLTTDLLKSLGAAEEFWFETAGFKDERLLTFIFYGVAVATCVVLFLGRFIPWRLIFIQSGWVGVILCHPKSKKFLVAVQKNKKPAKKIETPKDAAQIIDQKFDRKDIIVDDAAEVRVVEVFELQSRSVLKNEWKHYRYTNTLFDHADPLRAAGKRPRHGVDHLLKVLPPLDWKFDLGYANNWGIDTSPGAYLRDMSVDTSRLRIPEDDDGWIYDKEENGVVDGVYEFRRRRLVRDCFRYSRPPRRATKY